jgi:DNA recombination protein RmuC
MELVLISFLALVVVALAAAVVVLARRTSPSASGPATERLVAELEARLGREREHTVTAAADMAARMAGEKLGHSMADGARQLDLRSRAFDQRVEGLGAQLQQLGQVVTTLQRDAAEHHGQLTTGIEAVARTSRQLAETTGRLREVLASPKARGQWGERIADDVLRQAGMVEGVSYRKQTAIAGGTIPDVTFLLPGGRRLHMDVKFPIDNYVRHLEAATQHERDAAARAFLRDVRARVKELATRGYLDPADGLDQVLLFIPNESVWAFMHEHDAELIDVALAQKVVLCSPLTLFALLAVIRQAVEQAQLARTSDEILQCLAGFRLEWTKFSDSLDTVVKRFETAQRGLEEVTGPRRRQLERRLDRVDALRSQRGLDDPSPTAGGDDEAQRRAAGDVRFLGRSEAV